MAPQFGIRGVLACAKGLVIVCISAEENLLDEKAGRFLQNRLRMMRKRGRLSQGVNITDGNLQQESHPSRQGYPTGFED